MFSDNLTGNLLRICHAQCLTYETVAERCEISACYFGRIVRKEACPSVRILERICRGLQTTPQELLGDPARWPRCPRCRSPICQAQQNFCGNCGQPLAQDAP